jgi:hypothetical protein
MAKIRFEANVPVEIALKFAEGKRCPSALKDKDGNPLPDQMFYTLWGDDTNQALRLEVRNGTIAQWCGDGFVRR